VRAVLIFAATLAGAAATLSALAAEPGRAIDVGRALDAGALRPAIGDIAMTRTPPDPAPLVSQSQWVFDLRWDRGDVWLLGVHPLELPAPQATPRVMGRFAVELFEGPTLVERARFDFPLLGVPEAADASVSVASKLRTRIGVVFPASKRGTRLELWDRATGRRWSLPWPPADTANQASSSGAAATDAGATGPTSQGGRAD
jgi:hypothetical protein